MNDVAADVNHLDQLCLGINVDEAIPSPKNTCILISIIALIVLIFGFIGMPERIDQGRTSQTSGISKADNSNITASSVRTSNRGKKQDAETGNQKADKPPFITFVRYGPKDPSKNLFTLLTEQLGMLLIIAAFLERSLEAYVKVWRLPTREAFETYIENFKAKLKNTGTLEADQIMSVSEKVATAEIALRHYRIKTRYMSLVTAITVSLVLTLVGPRSLGQIFDFIGTVGAVQSGLMNSIDILITAGLIAGGTVAIHPILTASTAFFSESTKAVKAQAIK